VGSFGSVCTATAAATAVAGPHNSHEASGVPSRGRSGAQPRSDHPQSANRTLSIASWLDIHLDPGVGRLLLQ
jgi:hypothetical protein